VKQNFACGLCAVVLANMPAAADPTTPSQGLMQPPMEPYRNTDGTFRRFRNTIVTGYWSGYAVTASAPYSSASATWQVPSVVYDGALNPPYDEEAASNWVGIGGYGDATLIQLGTAGTVFTDGSTSYVAWYELYPAGAVGLSNPVRPGDIITASLQCTAACSPSSIQSWQLTLTNATAGWTWTKSFHYQSSMASAEWILEAPTVGSVVPLPDFDQATFSSVEANGLNPNLSLAANGVIMQNPWGETSNPSNPVDGDSFSICWGAIGAPLTACSANSFATPPPATTASLAASPTTISAGQSSTLTWSSSDATSCTGSNFTASATSGSAIVAPTVTTSYSVTCNGDGGSATSLVTVSVSSVTPTSGGGSGNNGHGSVNGHKKK
jgi:Peptidase A4 family